MRKKRGIITAIHGPMFSGKTEELLRRIRRAKIAKKEVQLFKPQKDVRYHENKVVPHHLAGDNANSLGESALVVSDANEIREKLSHKVNLVGIEEAQFFTEDLLGLVRELSEKGIDIVLSMLDQDFKREPFPIPDSSKNIGDYLAIAHQSIKLTAICVRCGAEAQHSQKLALTGQYKNGKPIYVPASYYEDVILVGTNRENSAEELPTYVYEARCKDCHEIPDGP